MGLLDWLSEGLVGGGSGGGGSMPPGMSFQRPEFGGGPPPQMPPIQQTGDDVGRMNSFNFGQMPLRDPASDGMPAPPSAGMMPPPTPPNPAADGLSMPPGMGPSISADGMPAPNSIGGAPGLPPGIPIPMARPAGAPQAQPPAPLPLPGGGGQPPLPPTDVSGAMRSYEAAGGGGPVQIAGQPPGGESTGRTIIGRALGLDGNRERQIGGALGAGMRAAGNSSGKSPFQAFSSGVGEGLKGDTEASDKTTAEQDKYLGRKIQAKGVENAELNSASTRELNVARTKLALEQAKMTKEGAYNTGGKAGTANSPQQLYLSGLTRVNNDPDIKLAKSTYDNLLRQYPPDSPEVKAAADAHKKLVEAKKTEILGSVGLKPAEIAKIGKMPGMAKDNPVPAEGLTKEKFDALPPGSYFINPKDKQVLIKKGPAAPAAGANPQVAPQQSMTPAMPPAPPAVTAPAGSRADNPDDEE